MASQIALRQFLELEHEEQEKKNGGRGSSSSSSSKKEWDECLANAAWPFGGARNAVQWNTLRVLAKRWDQMMATPGLSAINNTPFDAALWAMLKFLRGFAGDGCTSGASDAAIAALITGCVFKNLILDHASALNHCMKLSVGAAGILGAVVTANHIREWAMLPENAAHTARRWIQLCDWTDAALSDEVVDYNDAAALRADVDWMRGANEIRTAAAVLRARAVAVLHAAEHADPPVFAVVRALGEINMEVERALWRLVLFYRSVEAARVYWHAAAEFPLRGVSDHGGGVTSTDNGWFQLSLASSGADDFVPRQVLRSALANGPTIWRVPRTESRQAAAHTLLAAFFRLRRFGADWDVIPPPQKQQQQQQDEEAAANGDDGKRPQQQQQQQQQRHSLAVVLECPTPEEMRNSDAVVWIRFW